MKLEKREISLNEYDSLKDAFYTEKTLLGEYLQTLEVYARKQTKNELLRLIVEVGEDLTYVRELMEKIREKKE